MSGTSFNASSIRFFSYFLEVLQMSEAFKFALSLLRGYLNGCGLYCMDVVFDVYSILQ